MSLASKSLNLGRSPYMTYKHRAIASIAVFLVLIASTTQASATLYRLDATAVTFGSNPTPPSFWVDFDDTGDKLLQQAETVAFSGINLGPVEYEALRCAPNIAGFSVASGCTAGGLDNLWFFGLDPNLGNSGFAIQSSAFTYKLTALASNSVPEPSSLALLGLGLTGLAITRQRKAAKHSKPKFGFLQSRSWILQAA